MLPIELLNSLRAIKERIEKPEPLYGKELKDLLRTLPGTPEQKIQFEKDLSKIDDNKLVPAAKIKEIKKKFKPIFSVL